LSFIAEKSKIGRDRKIKEYNLIDRLICLVLTFSVSTTTIERAFFAIKVVKTRLHKKMKDGFLANNLVYIEREIAQNFNSDSMLDDFVFLKEQTWQF
jgi:hypothetical protein